MVLLHYTVDHFPLQKNNYTLNKQMEECCFWKLKKENGKATLIKISTISNFQQLSGTLSNKIYNILMKSEKDYWRFIYLQYFSLLSLSAGK